MNKLSEDILAFKLGKELYKEDAIILVTKIQSYFAACKHAEINIANTNHLAQHIFDQLSVEERMRCRRFHRDKHKEDKILLMDLETIFLYLESIMKDLVEKQPASAQVNSVLCSIPSDLESMSSLEDEDESDLDVV